MLKKLSISLPLIVGMLFACPRLAAAGEVRAFWADSWGAGFKTPEQTSALVAFAAKYELNAIFADSQARLYSPLRPRTGRQAPGREPHPRY